TTRRAATAGAWYICRCLPAFTERSPFLSASAANADNASRPGLKPSGISATRRSHFSEAAAASSRVLTSKCIIGVVFLSVLCTFTVHSKVHSKLLANVIRFIHPQRAGPQLRRDARGAGDRGHDHDAHPHAGPGIQRQRQPF